MNARSLHHRLRPCRVAAACALLAAAPAFAASGGSVSLGPITVQVFDLQPADGIAPTVEFRLQGLEAGVAAAAEETWPLELELKARYGSWQGTSIEASTRHASAGVSVSGGSTYGPAGTALSLHGQIVDFGGPPDALAAFVAQAVLASQGETIGFTLAPWTAVVVSMDVSAQLVTTHVNDLAAADVQMSMVDTVDGSQNLSDAFSLACAGACSAADGRVMGLTFLNQSDASLGGLWSVSANLSGTALASAVPEPGSAAMLLAGAGLLGSLARRRTRRD